MTDKEKIKAEVEKCISNYKDMLDKFDRSQDGWVDTVSMLEAKVDVLDHIIYFIDSLSEEPINEDLEGEINAYFNGWTFDDELSIMCKPNGYAVDEEGLKEAARHFANWQKEKMMKDAIEGLVICYEKLTQGYRNILFKFPDNSQVGYKVKLITVKEDEK